MVDDVEYTKFVDDLIDIAPSIFQSRPAILTDVGWYPLIRTLCVQIEHHVKSVNTFVRVMQIKEKFGGLRFYIDGGDECIRGMIQMACAMSLHICEDCGNPGRMRSDNWYRTLCDEHSKQNNGVGK